MNISFEKVQPQHIDTIFGWLNEAHIQEYWDMSQGHRDDILNFVDGRKVKSDYCDGLYTYWIGFSDGTPYCMVMALQEKPEYDIPAIKKKHLSKSGHTYSLDYMIGNPDYLGKGLGAKTLEAFTVHLHNEYDPKADTFFIDPDINNPRAKHVYEQAGFQYVGDFMMGGNGVFAGKKTHFLVKHL